MDSSPGVTRDLLAKLREIYGANSQRAGVAGRRWFGRLTPPAGKDASASLGGGVEIRSLRQPDDRTESMAGSTTGAKSILKGLLEASHAWPLVERQQVEPGRRVKTLR